MADWNHNGRYDPQDAFLDAETFEESTSPCHCEEGTARRGNPPSPSSLRRFLDGLLTALFWLFLLALVVLFF